jgi:hypothetical protein
MPDGFGARSFSSIYQSLQSFSHWKILLNVERSAGDAIREFRESLHGPEKIFVLARRRLAVLQMAKTAFGHNLDYQLLALKR